MGGDGGTIGSTRQFLRGAGAASTTADVPRHSTKELNEHKQDYALQSMRNCSLTGSPLNFGTNTSIVACAYGRLYNRESVIEALLRRKQSTASTGTTSREYDDGTLGGHVRGLRDLYAVRFQMEELVIDKTKQQGKESRVVPVCPVTGTVFNGTQPAFLIVKSSSRKKTPEDDEQRPNVISECALKEIGINALQLDFGPFLKENMIRLAPPTHGPEWEKIIAKVKAQQEQQENKKNSKKRQLAATAPPLNCAKKSSIEKKSNPNNMVATHDTLVDLRAVEVAKMNAKSALLSSSVLSTLFVQK